MTNLPANPMPPAVVELEPKEIFVLARNPQEMRQANVDLVLWADRRLASLRQERDEMQSAHDVAKKSKWRTEPLKAAVGRVEKRVQFYEKVKTALEAGYYIVPSFPIDMIAIRTTRRKAKQFSEERTWGHPALPAQATNSPPMGEGRYISPETDRRFLTIPKPHKDGSTTDYYRSITKGFTEDVDFPVDLAHPMVMQSTTEAMALKIFDEIGLFVDRRQNQQSVRRGDPMVIGRMKMRRGYQEIALSFVIAWWLDTSKI